MLWFMVVKQKEQGGVKQVGTNRQLDFSATHTHQEVVNEMKRHFFGNRDGWAERGLSVVRSFVRSSHLLHCSTLFGCHA